MAKLVVLDANQDHYEEMITLDHSITSNYSYRMQTTLDAHSSSFSFQRVKLPREAHVSYMRDKDSLLRSWKESSLIYVGKLDDFLVAYVVVDTKSLPGTARISDLVVMPELRQKGIGKTMLAAVEDWAAKNAFGRVLIEIPMRNYPMVELASHCGYQICGFMEHYFPNEDPALFYQKRLV